MQRAKLEAYYKNWKLSDFITLTISKSTNIQKKLTQFSGHFESKTFSNLKRGKFHFLGIFIHYYGGN